MDYSACMLTGTYNPELLLGGLGKRFESQIPHIKRYPGCGATQTTTHAVLELAGEHHIRAEDVNRVSIRVNEGHYWLCGENKGVPLTAADGLWNYRYLAAIALLKGKVFVDDITEESIRDPGILELIQRIIVEPDNSMTHAANVEIETKNGQKYRKNVVTVSPM